MKKINALLRSATTTLGVVLAIILASVFCGPVSSPLSTPQKPTGPTNLRAGNSYFFSTSAIAPDGGRLTFRFDWGDSNISDWACYVPSRQVDSAGHIWTKAGTFIVKAQAKDEAGDMSSWSAGLSVTVDTGIAGAIFFESFEDSSTWSHWTLYGWGSYIGRNARSGSYGAWLEDTGICYRSGEFIDGGMSLNDSVDVRNCSTAVVSFWYHLWDAWSLPDEGEVEIYIYANFTYFDNYSGRWQTVKVFNSLIQYVNGEVYNWVPVTVDVSRYCGSMRYAKLSLGIQGWSPWEYEKCGVIAWFDDIALISNSYQN